MTYLELVNKYIKERKVERVDKKEITDFLNYLNESVTDGDTKQSLSLGNKIELIEIFQERVTELKIPVTRYVTDSINSASISVIQSLIDKLKKEKDSGNKK